MTHRERMLAVLEGRRPDRIPWVPRLGVWYLAHERQGTLPAKYRGLCLRDIERDLGVGTPARHGRIFRTELHGVDVRVEEHGMETRTEYVTPVGAVWTLHRRSKQLDQYGIMGMEVEHMIKGPGDYPVVEYIVQNTEIIPTYEEYLAYEEETGEDGLPLVYIGKDPMTDVMQEYVGYGSFFYHMQDFPAVVHHLVGVLAEKAGEIQQVALDSPARLILHGQHFDSQMTPPPFFREHILPYYRAFSEKLHGRGKKLAFHADADTRLLLDLIVEAGFDMVESFITAPTVRVTLEEARAAFGNRVIIWGGIPSIMLSDMVSEEQFEDYMLGLFRAIAPGDAFMLGISDGAMPDTLLERVERVGEMVEMYRFDGGGAL